MHLQSRFENMQISQSAFQTLNEKQIKARFCRVRESGKKMGWEEAQTVKIRYCRQLLISPMENSMYSQTTIKLTRKLRNVHNQETALKVSTKSSRLKVQSNCSKKKGYQSCKVVLENEDRCELRLYRFRYLVFSENGKQNVRFKIRFTL